MTNFHDLARWLDDLDAPPADLEGLVARGESRLRRRRLRTAVACAVAIAVLAVGGVLVEDHRTQGAAPVDLPGPRPTQKQRPTAPATRQIVFAGGLGDPTIRYGNRTVKVRTGYVHLDVTDDGFIFTTPGPFQRADPTVWFSDGRAPERIGTHCGQSSQLTPNDVMTGSSGSLAVWFACSKAAGRELVVYDTWSDTSVTATSCTA